MAIEPVLPPSTTDEADLRRRAAAIVQDIIVRGTAEQSGDLVWRLVEREKLRQASHRSNGTG